MIVLRSFKITVRLDCPLSSCKDIQGTCHLCYIYMKPSLLTVSPPLLFQQSSGDGLVCNLQARPNSSNSKVCTALYYQCINEYIKSRNIQFLNFCSVFCVVRVVFKNSLWYSQPQLAQTIGTLTVSLYAITIIQSIGYRPTFQISNVSSFNNLKNSSTEIFSIQPVTKIIVYIYVL